MKLKLLYTNDDNSIEEYYELIKYSSFEDKIKSIFKLLEKSGDDLYCQVLNCLEEDEYDFFEVEVKENNLKEFKLNELILRVEYIPELSSCYDFNYFVNQEINLESFVKRITQEEKKDIPPKKVKITYETPSSTFVEDLGEATSFDEFSKLVKNCDLYKYSSQYYQGDNQGRFSVGFSIYFNDQFLGVINWFRDDMSFEEFIENGDFESDFDFEYYCENHDYNNKNIINFILSI